MRYAFLGDRESYGAEEPFYYTVHYITPPVRDEHVAWREFKRFAQLTKQDYRVLAILRVAKDDAYECKALVGACSLDKQNN